MIGARLKARKLFVGLRRGYLNRNDGQGAQEGKGCPASQILVLLNDDRRRVRFAGRMNGGATMPKQTIESTAGEVTDELMRRGLSPQERVTITLESDQELIPGRKESRARVMAAGLTDADIDRLIEEARSDERPALG